MPIIYIENESYVLAKPEFVASKRRIAMLIEEDKHLKDVINTNRFGEAEIAGEILSIACENSRQDDQPVDQEIFTVRIISTYVTFYFARIPKEYWDEIGNDFTKKAVS